MNFNAVGVIIVAMVGVGVAEEKWPVAGIALLALVVILGAVVLGHANQAHP